MRKQNRRGSHAVEFALLFPIFITFIFGGICDGVNLCSVLVDASEGPTDNVWMLECSAELLYQPIVGMVPMPMLLSAQSTQPVEIQVEETGA